LGGDDGLGDIGGRAMVMIRPCYHHDSIVHEILMSGLPDDGTEDVALESHHGTTRAGSEMILHDFKLMINRSST
jgi:hypothetical protein